jgi:hypothetical protein
MAFWMTELPGGGFAMGEAPDEVQARAMIERQQQAQMIGQRAGPVRGSGAPSARDTPRAAARTTGT